MDNPEIITATEASRSFSDLLHRVCYKGESFIIKKGNRLMACIIPMEQEALAREVEKKSVKSSQPLEIKPMLPKQEAAPAKKVESISPAGMSVPEGFSQEDVDFYQNLIATMRGAQ
jgi:antitoxin (DNA-binding transcriptional repressor) of toxin-antitoxin stability system